MKLKSKLKITKSFAIFGLMIVAIFSIVFQGCQKEELFWEDIENHFDDAELKGVSISENDWIQQLNYLVNNDIQFMQNNGIKLLGYTTVATVDSKNKMDIAIQEMFQNDTYIPLYEGVANSIRLTPIHNIPIKYMNQFTPENLKNYLSEIDPSDLKKLVLDWQYNDDYFSTTCLVSDKNGIIYDNIISNVMIIEMKEESEVIFPVVRLKSASAEGEDGAVSYSRAYGATAYWLWGGERGEARIAIYVGGQVINGTKFINSHTETATDYISIGTSGSAVTMNSFSTGSSGHYDVAWAWYLASPLVSATITFTGGNYTIEMGTVLGSEGHGSGRSYISPNDLN